MVNPRPIIIAGGGHAGVEAALAAAKLGAQVFLISLSSDSIARMSCNPAIGGLAKGQIVKEIDALGGIMGTAADLAGIQFKMLNKSKGRAVWGPRAQVDKRLYSSFVKDKILYSQNLTLIPAEVVGFEASRQTISKVILSDGTKLDCSALILTTGTFQNGLIHIGNETYAAGRFGEKPSKGLTECLRYHGFSIGRLKTGTPPRLKGSSINWDITELAYGDKNPIAFSSLTEKPFQPKNIPCHVTYTGKICHQLLAGSLQSSALFSGKIKGIGPRYCPSIEDKIVRFPDRDQHQLFLEPEWSGSDQIYVNGFSTSMPRDIQLAALSVIPGLEKAEMIRPGYAIEYDYCRSTQLNRSLESKLIKGLFFAGQINGTSGYEEAAAQGLIAGINAVKLDRLEEPLILQRNEAYIGVLIDDLTTKYIDEPYRMFSSSAEYRLSLRQDTADLRLSTIGYHLGTVPERQFSIFQRRQQALYEIKQLLKNHKTRNNSGDELISYEKKLLQNGIDLNSFKQLIPQLQEFYSSDLFTAETDIKYGGYLAREQKRIEQMVCYETLVIPSDFDYYSIGNLSTESREKLTRVRPETIGQASRISGVNPSDLSVLTVYLKQ